jgi:Domain of unknown function (DUF222)
LITRSEAGRRVREAADLGARRGLTGQPLAPVLAGAAAAQRHGKLGAGQVAVIRGFCHIAAGGSMSPRAIVPKPIWPNRVRSIGPSSSGGWLPRWPTASIPTAATPMPTGPGGAVLRWAPSKTTTCRSCVAGFLPSCGPRSSPCWPSWALQAAIIVSTTLAELQAAAGRGLTGRGTLLPMSDVIRLARHARHYLAIFDKGKAIGLYHTKRLASPGQRIVLYAKHRGCTAPGCTVPGYYSEVHHCTDYAQCRTTDVNDLAFGCGPHHRMLKPGGWTTRTNARGDTEWIPPPHLDRGQSRTNTFWHPEKLLSSDDDGDDDGE